MSLETTGKYAIIKENAVEDISKEGIYLGAIKPYLRGVVVSHPDPSFDGKEVAYVSFVKKVEDYDVVSLDAILCVVG